MKNPFLSICLFSLLSFSISAQLPSTDLYLFEITKDSENQLHVHSPKFLNSFNLNGYNNQPSFINEEEIFFTVNKPGMDNTDIYLMNIRNRTLKRVTATDESEYSPTLMKDYTNFSCIRVNEKNEQHLWQYPLNRSDQGKAIIEDLTNVGYHSWLSPSRIALFLVNEPVQLGMIDLPNTNPSLIGDEIGRSLLPTAQNNLRYVHKYSDEYWYIKEYNPSTYRSEIIVQTKGNNEDFTMMQDGTLLMGDQSILYKYTPGQDSEWIPMLDLAVYGINKISRLAVNNSNQLIVTHAKSN